MKKAINIVIFIVMVGAMTALSSCSKSNENKIHGNWKCVSAIAYNNGTSHVLQQFIDMIVEFREDGLYSVNGGEVGVFTVDGDTLTLKDNDGDCVVFDITSLNSTKLNIKMIGIIEDDEYEPTENAYEVYEFERI